MTLPLLPLTLLALALAGTLAVAASLALASGRGLTGKLNLLAVGSLKRTPLFPDTPTLDELGLKGFDADSWFGCYAPAATPKDIVVKLNAEMVKVFKRPDVQTRLTEMGAEFI